MGFFVAGHGESVLVAGEPTTPVGEEDGLPAEGLWWLPVPCGSSGRDRVHFAEQVMAAVPAVAATPRRGTRNRIFPAERSGSWARWIRFGSLRFRWGKIRS